MHLINFGVENIADWKEFIKNILTQNVCSLLGPTSCGWCQTIWISNGWKQKQIDDGILGNWVWEWECYPTTIRPDLNSFSAWLHRPLRPDQYTIAHAARFDGPQALARRPPTRTVSPHILTGLESIFLNQSKIAQVTLVIFIMKGLKISQTSKISWAVQLTRLLRFGSFDPILDPTLV